VTPTSPPELRAARLEDVDGAYEVAAARARADGTIEHLNAIDLRRSWERLDLAREAWVAEEDGTVVAAACLARDSAGASVLVRPESTGRGIGTALREAVEARAATRGGVVRQHVPDSNPAARALLEGAGYVDVHQYASMLLELDGALPEPRVPEGIELRPFVAGHDERPLHDVDIAAFGGQRDYEPVPFEVFRARYIEAPSTLPHASPLAWEGDRLLGYALNQRRGPGIGVVAILAVAPDAQRRGLGRALLLRSFALLREAGATTAGLGVASYNDPARALYESAGMRQAYVMHRYEKRL
jgi:mycothiol synthase